MPWLLLLLLLSPPLFAAPDAAPVPARVPEVVVVASQLRATDLAGVPASITVLDADVINGASLQHFEELTPLLPNINWSGEGSRARYFQIRGTGELEQYEGAPNPSVGFIVDDIDLSGIGGVATTFDVGRIELLRGPQGTRYGANALAGLIYVETGQPTATPGATVSGTVGTDGTWGAGGVLNGPLAGRNGELTGRLAVQQFRSDGFRHNAWLGRDDTSGQNELTARAKLRWEPAPDIAVQLTAFHVDLDNGYDDFALSNGFTTYSDKPGEDSQQTDAAALRATIGLGGVADLVSITGVASSDIVYSFDADWGNPEYWAPWVYAFTQRNTRQRDTINQELRLVSRADSRVLGADWLVGVYALHLTEDIGQVDTANCPAFTCGEDFIYDTSDSPLSSAYAATNLAGYAEFGWQLGGSTRLVGGVRREVRDARYRDSSDFRLDPVDRMVGGDLTLTHTLARAGATAPATTLWARVAQGYKAGGFNPSAARFPEAADRLEFQPESLWNYEAGLRASTRDGRLWTALSGFVQQRRDPQLKIPEQLRPGDPASFLFFTENAERVSTRGIEFEGGWQALEPLELGMAIGLLDTRIDRFSVRPELEGQDLAHAPRYTFAVNGTWRAASGWFARLDYTGKGGYAIDYCQTADCRDPRTGAYQLLGLSAGRAWGPWSVEAWSRNLLDERYVVRGFYFGNEPPDFTKALYTRLGDPRQSGVTVSYAW